MKNLFFALFWAFLGQQANANNWNAFPFAIGPTPCFGTNMPPKDSTQSLRLPLGGVFTATIGGVVCTLNLTDNGVKGSGRTALGSLSGTCSNFLLDNGIVADPFTVTGTYVPWTTLNSRYLIQISGAGSQFDPKGESATAGRVRFCIATISGFAENPVRDAPLTQFTSFITTTKDIRGLGKDVTFSQPVVWRRK